MMRALVATLLLGALTVPNVVLAGEPEEKDATTEQTTEVVKAAKKVEKVEKTQPKKVCRRIQDTGSRSSKRLCLTREQWQEFNNGN